MAEYSYRKFVVENDKREDSSLARTFLLKANKGSNVIIEGEEYEVRSVVKTLMRGATLRLNKGRLEYDMEDGKLYHINNNIREVEEVKIFTDH